MKYKFRIHSLDSFITTFYTESGDISSSFYRHMLGAPLGEDHGYIRGYSHDEDAFWDPEDSKYEWLSRKVSH